MAQVAWKHNTSPDSLCHLWYVTVINYLFTCHTGLMKHNISTDSLGCLWKLVNNMFAWGAGHIWGMTPLLTYRVACDVLINFLSAYVRVTWGLSPLLTHWNACDVLVNYLFACGTGHMRDNTFPEDDSSPSLPCLQSGMML